MKKPPHFPSLPLFLKKRMRRKNAVFLLPIPNEKRTRNEKGRNSISLRLIFPISISGRGKKKEGK